MKKERRSNAKMGKRTRDIISTSHWRGRASPALPGGPSGQSVWAIWGRVGSSLTAASAINGD